MTITIEAIDEDGVPKPAQPLPLTAHERVQIIVQTPPLDILQAQGIVGWKGTSAELAPFALDPEFEYPPGLDEPGRSLTWLPATPFSSTPSRHGSRKVLSGWRVGS
jgi:predicted DNA-binding antitoxin AbrB/MazE fold protein